MKDVEVTIRGIAKNTKSGAIVISEKSKLYYIDGIDSWTDNISGKKVKVTGILNVKIYKEEDLKNEDGGWIQGVEGEKNTIKLIKYKIIF